MRTAWLCFVLAAAGCRSNGAERSARPVLEAPSPESELDRLDTRTPVPLLPMMAHHQKENMRDHLVAVRDILSAASAADFESITKAVPRIGYSEEMHRMCSHMGASTPGFTERALAFHRTADGIGDAAQQRDLPSVLRAVADTLSACTGCHEAFKQRVVSAPPSKHPGGGASP